MEVVRYVLEWESGSDPVTGRLIAPDASQHSFAGWLEFLRVADELRAAETSAAAEKAAEHPERPR
jgi:hypothetical protein